MMTCRKYDEEVQCDRKKKTIAVNVDDADADHGDERGDRRKLLLAD
jgi:hypothetical protein